MQGHSLVFLSQYLIWGITTHTVQIVEEFPEIKGSYLRTEKELAALLLGAQILHGCQYLWNTPRCCDQAFSFFRAPTSFCIPTKFFREMMIVD